MSSSDDDDIPISRKVNQLRSRAAAPITNHTPDPAEARTDSVVNESSDSEDEVPLRKIQRKEVQRQIKKEDTDDDDDVPLRRIQKETKRPIKDESSDDEDLPLSKKRALKTSAAGSSTKKVKKADATPAKKPVPKKRASEAPAKPNKRVKKEEKEAEDENVYKWWEGDNENDDSVKWTELIHAGVLFPPEYEPHGIKMKYNGQKITLTPEAEEVASFFAALLETDHGKNPTFQKNFFRDFQVVLASDPKNPPLQEFEKCDFRPIWEKFEKDKEVKKALTKDEKLKIKEEKAVLEEPFLYATVDGRKEKVGNFRIEPPGLFRGRGDHPKTGTLKKRVYPEQVTLNLSKDAPVPPTIPGHKWKDIVHEKEATWLATWKENVNGTYKYVFLAANSSWKGQSDMNKFDKARELKKCVKQIRASYTIDLKDKLMEKRQRATAMYLIDRLALRAGNEKGDDEADTVGCCSLRYEHIDLEAPNTVHFDFLGKDSIRYQNSVQVDTQVFKNLKIFKKQVGPGGDIFDRLTTTGLNKHLNSYMKGLSAKVFRTYNASHTCEQQLEKLTNNKDPLPDKILSFNRANREVAVLCNHQRNASKNHAQQMLKITDKLRAIKYQRMKLRKQLFTAEPSMKKKRPDLTQDESDMEDDWIVDHERDLMEKERERTKVRFERQNEKLKADGKAVLPNSDLKAKLKAVDEMEAELKRERKTGKVEVKGAMTADKLLIKIEKLDDRINATKVQATDKEENKEISLGTSKMNYIDPRIIVAWCRKNEVPVEKVYSKTLVDKFRWAQNIPDDWKF
ncbi:hypothetical protein DM01DRAFT_1335682 [Hesseltinella vesiculosa]|uniref:DNA topoisomerase I n=1 Tax=Hesseltinella vesiculosa TaxID=101127 RepID=A0A1X2GIK0_9FUNG|nr:hypothetical protein DM01DRAFT_1335682 [Hesseltinella vesiculosa]